MSVVVNRTIGLETCTIENWTNAQKVLEFLGFAGFVDYIVLLLWIER